MAHSPVTEPPDDHRPSECPPGSRAAGMSDTALVGDIILASALGIILLLEVRKHRDGGQAIVELALAFPVMALLLLGVLGAGLLFVTAERQQAATNAVASWAAANPSASPGDLASFAAAAGDCPSGAVTASYGPNLVTVRQRCTTWVGGIVPGGLLPSTIATTATAFVPKAASCCASTWTRRTPPARTPPSESGWAPPMTAAASCSSATRG